MKGFYIAGGVEILLTFVLLILVKTNIIDHLWHQEYLDNATKQWVQGPIVDIKEIDSDESCDSGVMAYETGLGYNEYYDKFEILAQGYWWGWQAGCVCTYVRNANLGQCREEDLKNGCLDIKSEEGKYLEVVNEKKLCARRTELYNFLTSPRPEKSGDKLVCKDEKMPKLCGDNVSQALCVPADAKCPLRGVSWDKKGQLMLSFNSDQGEPLIDLRLSEGGPPCAEFNKFTNSLQGKQEYKLFKKDYYETCPNFEEHGNTYNTSRQFVKVDTFASVSEYDLYQQNSQTSMFSSKKTLFEKIEKLPRFDIELLKEYKFDLYELHYSDWHDQCLYINDKQEQKQVTPSTLIPILDETWYLVMWAKVVYYIVWVMLYIQIIELMMAFMYKETMDAEDGLQLSKRSIVNIIRLRRLLTLILNGCIFYIIKMIYAWSGHEPIEAIINIGCSKDQILIDSFKAMLNYLNSSQNLSLRYWLYVFMISITGMSLMGVFCPIDGPDDDKFQSAGKKKRDIKIDQVDPDEEDDDEHQRVM